MTRFCFVFLTWLSAAICFGAEITLAQPVRVSSGLLRGVSNPESPVTSFKGVPYAAPPVGALRWREPQPPAAWSGIRLADSFGAPCVQPASPSGKPAPENMAEDCLFLNIWTPAATPTDKLPVLFWIHGGAGFFGSGNINGEPLARKGVIVVSVNYRLGLFAGMGHPALTAESPHKVCGNYGLLDLIAGLRWVRDNITSFGGDPARVTIAGHSSGSSLAHYLTTSPEAKGLFHGLIGVSFPYDYLIRPNTIPFVRQKEANGLEFAKIKGASNVEELRKIPALAFVTPDPAIEKAKLIHLGSGVARDGWAFPLAYPDALAQGLISDVPTMTGMTADDFGPPAPFMKTTVASFKGSLPKIPGQAPEAFLALCPEITTDTEARDMAKKLQLENGLCATFYWAKRRAKISRAPVYTYLFEQCVESPRGAYHGSDLAYFFNDLAEGDRTRTDTDRRVADLVSTYWVNFVTTSNPNGPNLPAWKSFESTNHTTMSLGSAPAARPIADTLRQSYYGQLFDN